MDSIEHRTRRWINIEKVENYKMDSIEHRIKVENEYKMDSIEHRIR